MSIYENEYLRKSIKLLKRNESRVKNGRADKINGIQATEKDAGYE